MLRILENSIQCTGYYEENIFSIKIYVNLLFVFNQLFQIFKRFVNFECN